MQGGRAASPVDDRHVGDGNGNALSVRSSNDAPNRDSYEQETRYMLTRAFQLPMLVRRSTMI